MAEAHQAIKVVARRTGLSAPVIRIWEKRYGAVEPDGDYVWWTDANIKPAGELSLNVPRHADPAIQRALAFVSRAQNLESPHNTLPHPAKNPDGGFYYTPANGGESQAGTLPNGGLRSYGSMTYAGLKSMIFAGLTKSDPRVKAATAWLRKHYTFVENPGLGDAGLYYYFHTAAKALDVLGEDRFTDAAGQTHDWKAELSAAILAKQKPDGSWINANNHLPGAHARMIARAVDAGEAVRS
jgi:hypothetical protein